MERSIENIWKEGFLKNDELVAPKINNLYDQKSIHIIDKFKRMFRINLIAIIVFSFVFLSASYFIGIPITGILFFVMLSILVYLNKRLLNDLEQIDLGSSSYQYLKAFNQWKNKQISVNKKLSRFLYPFIFISMILGFWFKDAEGMPLGERLVNKVILSFPDLYLIVGIPLIGIVIIFIILIILAYFGDRIYTWDLNIVYGRVFRKLEELMTEIESLRN